LRCDIAGLPAEVGLIAAYGEGNCHFFIAIRLISFRPLHCRCSRWHDKFLQTLSYRSRLEVQTLSSVSNIAATSERNQAPEKPGPEKPGPEKPGPRSIVSILLSKNGRILTLGLTPSEEKNQ
jgi:hypothetical protein